MVGTHSKPSKVKKQRLFTLSFFNNGQEDIEIQSFRTDIAEKVELHDIKVVDDVVKMVKVKNVKIERKRELFLQPGGKHLMLFNLKKLNDKDSFTLEIQQKNNKILETTIMVLKKNSKIIF